jgi:hypothetical protein
MTFGVPVIGEPKYSRAALDSVSSNVQNIQINVAHLGMGFNRKVWKVIKDSLYAESQKRLNRE